MRMVQYVQNNILFIISESTVGLFFLLSFSIIIMYYSYYYAKPTFTLGVKFIHCS